MAVLVDLDHVSARRPDRPLFEHLSLTISDGDRVGVVGINGTGKSTLLRLIAGVDAPEEGSVRRGRGTRVGWLDQDPRLPSGTVIEAVGAGWEAAAALERLGMGGHAEVRVEALSGGQAKRVAMARVLAHPCELLVLDEPTNHLDLGGVSWLEQRLSKFPGGVVLVSHDRHLLDRVTTRMIELDRGRTYVHEAGYASYLEHRFEREEHAATSEATRRNLARRELAWLRRGAPARSRKPQARIDAAKRIVEGRAEASARAGDLEMSFATPRLGDKVVELYRVGYRYPPSGPQVLSGVDPPSGPQVLSGVDPSSGPQVLSGVDMDVAPDDRLGIVGGNGTGKSTLLDLVAGRREPTTGRVETGTTVVIGYHDQRGVDLDLGARVRDLVAGPTRVAGTPEDNRLMERFWFDGELQFARAGTLSGGERRRLQLLLVLAGRPNVLLLDEPTNDLDLDTLRILEDFLDDWPGALVTVSHDRTFLDRTTERILAFDGSGALGAVPGGLAAWVAATDGSSRGRPPSSAAVANLLPSKATTAIQAKAGTAVQAKAGTTLPSKARTAAADKASKQIRPRSASTVGYQLRETEKELRRLQGQRDKVAEALIATGDHREMARLGSELTNLQAGLDEAEERWLALAEEDEAGR